MKRIALFIGQLFGDYQLEIANALKAESKAQGYQLDIFINFGAYGSNFLYAEGEKSIRFIPDISLYEGVIMASDTFELPGFDTVLSKYIRSFSDIPVVSLRQEDENCYNVMTDDEQSMRLMVEHFVEHHKFTNVCFMTGKLEMKDAQLRLKGYMDVMEEHNIPVTEHMVFEGDYWRGRGKAAVDWFFDQEEKPQAIVCSNDYMAVSVSEALNEKGIRVPEDVCLSGFDDIAEVKYNIPPITSLHVPSYEMGKRAIELISEIRNGGHPDQYQRLPVNLIERASCGCTNSYDSDLVAFLLAQKVSLENTLSYLSYMSVSFEHADSMESLFATANFYLRYMPFNKLYVCVCDPEEMDMRTTDVLNPYTDHMILKAILGNADVDYCNERFDRSDLIPGKYREEGSHLFVVTLHDKSDYFGYLAMQGDDLTDVHQVFQLWILSLADAWGKLKMYEDSKELTDLRDKYETDTLTGIGNRRKLDHIVRTRHERLVAGIGNPFALLSIDMDDLKTINDTFGHQEGDKALYLLAHILADECGELGDAMRTGGDEFQVCLDSFDGKEITDYIDRVRESINEVNASGEYPFRLSASIGYALCTMGMPLMESMKIADDRMYAEKRAKKKKSRN